MFKDISLPFMNRNNPDEWAHPELQDMWRTCCLPQNNDQFVDPDIPFETRKANCIKHMSQFTEFIKEGLNVPGVVTYDVPGCEEEPDAPIIQLKIVRPKGMENKKLPVLLTIPAGGLFQCLPWNSNPVAEAEKFGCVSATFVYRTTFEGPYPAAINDCAAVYKYLVENAKELKIKPNKILIMGESSGGHLTLALTHRLKKHDYYGHIPCGVIAKVPVLDDRTIYPSSRFEKDGWNGLCTHQSSTAWLHKNTNTADVPAEAFPNHATVEECIGLPPTVIHTGELDPCSDPCFEYILKLKTAGVYATFHCWAGTEHACLQAVAFQTPYDSPEASYGRRFTRIIEDEIEDFFKYDLTRAWQRK